MVQPSTCWMAIWPCPPSTSALPADEIEARYRDQGLTPPAGPGLLACWPLTEERGEQVADCSSHERHGRIVNSATWMIGGPSFDGNQVPRFGDYDPARDPRRGHAVRFASDDLYDCRWQVTHEYQIPKTARPGIYVGRFRFELDGIPRIYHATLSSGRPPSVPADPRDRGHGDVVGLQLHAVCRHTSRVALQLGYRRHHQFAGQSPREVHVPRPRGRSARLSNRCSHALAGRRALRPLQRRERRLQPPDARNGSPWSGWRRAVTSTTWWATWTSTRIRNCWTPTRWW